MKSKSMETDNKYNQLFNWLILTILSRKQFKYQQSVYNDKNHLAYWNMNFGCSTKIVGEEFRIQCSTH